MRTTFGALVVFSFGWLVSREAAAEPLTLARALDIVRQSNPDLLAVRQELEIARGRLVKAEYPNPFNPEIGGDGGHRRLGNGGSGTDYGVAVSQELEVAGQRGKRIDEARANVDVARRNYEREDRLFKRRISSEKDYLEAKGEYERSDAAFRASREALRLLDLAETDIEQVTWGGREHPLSHFPILAPFAGTVIEQHITIGELIKPEEKPYTIADLSTLWIVIDVYEKDLGRVAIGTAVEVRVDAYPDERFAGQIVYLSDVLDEATRTARARVEVDNHASRLRPGMFATASIALPNAAGAPAVTIPTAAVQRSDGRPVAFVEDGAGTYVLRHVTLGRDMDGRVEVLARVAAGDRVVTDGSFTLKSEILKDQLAGEE